jgi:hypothetical protein
MRRQKTTAQFDRLGPTPRSDMLLHLYTSSPLCLFTFAFRIVCLLLAAVRILVGLISLQPFPFFHPISRLADAALAFWRLGEFLSFSTASLIPHGRVAPRLVAARPEFPDRFRFHAWTRAANVRGIAIFVPYRIVLAFKPALLIEWWPRSPGPAYAVSLVNTLLLVVLTQLLFVVSWLPGQWLRSLERRLSSEEYAN